MKVKWPRWVKREARREGISRREVWSRHLQQAEWTEGGNRDMTGRICRHPQCDGLGGYCLIRYL
jgi:hypothetical protein